MAWIILIVVGAAVASNLSADEEAPRNGLGAAKTAKADLLREGTRMESRRAKCRVNSDRLTLEFEDGRQMDSLNNLAAQRLLQACRDDSTESYWIVTGKVTEFQNANFLYIEHIIRAVSR